MKNFLLLLLVSLILGFSVKWFALEVFMVPTESMEPTIRKGAKVWVNKVMLGFFNKKDIVSFERFGENFVKRIVGVPHDTVYFDGQKFQVLKENQILFKKNIYNLPLFIIPKKGQKIFLDEKNRDFYLPLIEKYEEVQAGNIIGKIFINNAETDHYTFKYNYYFIQGDNTEESLDSRNFGLIPEKNIIGEVLFYQ